MEIGDEFQEKEDTGEDLEYLFRLVDEIVPFLVNHNAEPDACDLLIEVEKATKKVLESP
jgi:26S proteasome regulatory subunit N1